MPNKKASDENNFNCAVSVGRWNKFSVVTSWGFFKRWPVVFNCFFDCFSFSVCEKVFEVWVFKKSFCCNFFMGFMVNIFSIIMTSSNCKHHVLVKVKPKWIFKFKRPSDNFQNMQNSMTLVIFFILWKNVCFNLFCKLWTYYFFYILILLNVKQNHNFTCFNLLQKDYITTDCLIH